MKHEIRKSNQYQAKVISNVDHIRYYFGLILIRFSDFVLDSYL